MRTAGTRAEVFPAPQAWGSPRADSLFAEEGRRGSGRRVWRGSGGKNPGTVGSEERQGRAGLGSTEPAWRPLSLGHSACRTPSGASLWLSLGWDTGPAVMQPFQVHRVFTCSLPPVSQPPLRLTWGCGASFI